MAKNMPFWTGKNCKVLLLLDGNKIPFEAQSWDVGPRVVELDIQIQGADRSEPQNEIDGFDINLNGVPRGTKELDAMMDSIANDDQMVYELDKDCAIVIKRNDGTRAAYKASGKMVFGKWKLASGGRTQTATFNLPIRCQYFKPVSL